MAFTLGTTSNGKEIQAVMQASRCLYRIQFKDGGQIPKEFDGEYTSVGECKRVTDVYLANHKPRAVRSKEA